MSKRLDIYAIVSLPTLYSERTRLLFELERNKRSIEYYGGKVKEETPPTEQEVCEAYYKCRNTPLVYDKTLKRFTEIKGGRAQGRIIARLICDNLDIPHILPPHLVEMIGKFYKGK